MDFGLIGKNIAYSYSPEIHQMFNHRDYKIVSLKETELADFLGKRDFQGINVTIPYKEKVIPYLDFLDETVIKTGAVNTITNTNGFLKGYNTDYLSFYQLLQKNKINLIDKKCLVLGSGATSKTVCAVLKDLGVLDIAVASRSPHGDMVAYQSLNRQSYDIIINATPVGTFPDYNKEPLDLGNFKQTEVVIDFVYNPLRTKLIQKAVKMKMLAINGLELLVTQAYFARQLWDNCLYEETLITKIVHKIYQDKLNIVLIGMPYSGKSSIAIALGEKLGKQVVDIDNVIEQKTKQKIAAIFSEIREEGFREFEKQVIKEMNCHGCVIATGGGSVLDEDNMAKLSSEGFIVYIQRNKDKITIKDSTRPLFKTRADWEKIASQRELLYPKYADVVIDNNQLLEEAVLEISEKYWQYIKREK